jgi:hypothetical protein
MQARTILLRCFAVPLRQKFVAVGIAVAIGSGLFLWSRYGAAPPATTAVLSFDASAARQADPGVMNANAKEPAVALARSILSDEAVRELAKQAGLSFSSNKSEVAEFRSRLDMAQTSAKLLRVNYKDTDKKRSAAAANAVANLLVAWIPPSLVPTPASAPPPSAQPAFPKSDRRRHSLHAQSRDLRELEKQLAAVERKLTAANGHAITSQQADVAAPSSTDNEQRRTLESQLSAAQKKLDNLLTRYTDEYPDVESTRDDISEIRQKLASLPAVSNEAERAAGPPADANETDQLRQERAHLMQAILVEKRREAERWGQTALAAQTVSLPVAGQAPIRQSLNPVAEQIWQRPFGLVRLAGDAGAGQSESGLLWYGPLAGILWGLLYSGVAMWRYRPIERKPGVTEPNVELGLAKKLSSSQEKAIIEAALTECAATWCYRPIERAAQLEPPLLNPSQLSAGSSATEPRVELGLAKKSPSPEKALIEAGTSGTAAKLGLPASILESKLDR